MKSVKYWVSAGMFVLIGAGMAAYCFAAAPAAQPASPAAKQYAWYCGAVKSVAEGGPSAHNPCYDNKEWWPEMPENVGKPAAQRLRRAFETQAWPKARLLVWAKPGVSGDGADGASWLEDGKPATSPPDENTDVLLPASDTPYTTAPANKGRFVGRHVTIENNASGGGYRYRVSGNVWVKEGGRISSGHAAGVDGPTHSFFRNDNLPDAKGITKKIGQYMGVNKPGGSVEFMGIFWITDEMGVKAGTMILAPDSEMYPGPNSVQGVSPEGTLALLSGAKFHKWAGNTGSPMDIHIQGRLLAGLPDRPLTRDATLGISFKNKDDACGLKVDPAGSVVVHSVDPTKRRLVIKWHEKNQQNPGDTPQFVRIVFLSDQRLNGVLFDFVQKGGIRLANPASRLAWKNIFFGDNNEGTPDELFAAHGSS